MTTEATMTTTTQTPMPGTLVHKFESAGLGKAPFRFVRYYESKYQACHGAPVQPGTCCDYCGTSIMGVYVIRSADRKEFKVGCDCVHKTGDAGLKRVVDRAKRDVVNAKRHAREAALIAEGKAILAREDVRARLAAEPHPTDYRAAKGETRLDWAEWYMRNAGNAGRCDVTKYLKTVGA